MNNESRDWISDLENAPDLVPGDGELSLLTRVEGSALFHEEVTLLIDPDADSDSEDGDGVSGVLEWRYPASAILGWRIPKHLRQLLSALEHDPSTWTVSEDPGFAARIEGVLHQKPEDPNKGEGFFLMRNSAGIYREIENAELLESGDEEYQVGFRADHVFTPTLAWRDRETLQLIPLHRPSDLPFSWCCSLLLRLAGACGFPVPDRLASGFAIAHHYLPDLRDAASRCLSQSVRNIERFSLRKDMSKQIEAACTDALILDVLAGRPDRKLTETLIRLGGEPPRVSDSEIAKTNSCGDRLRGEGIVFTGGFANGIQRQQAKELAVSQGATPADSITGKTTILVVAGVGHPIPADVLSSNKAKQAIARGIRLMSEPEFLQCVKGTAPLVPDLRHRRGTPPGPPGVRPTLQQPLDHRADRLPNARSAPTHPPRGGCVNTTFNLSQKLQAVHGEMLYG